MSFVVRSLLFALVSAVAWGQSSSIITTVAGSDPKFDEGLPLLGTPLGAITAATFDSQGRLYLAVNNRVVRATSAGTFAIVAGNGVEDYSGDGGPATSASLGNPLGLAVDRAGNIYISDSDNAVIRKVDLNGIITTIAGTGDPQGPLGDGGQATNASLNLPAGLVIDAQGNIYVAEKDGHRVRQISPSGVIRTVAGTGTSGYNGDNLPATSAQLNEPHGLALDPSGALLIADSSNNLVRRVIIGGNISSIAGNGDALSSGEGIPATRAGVPQPTHIAADPQGNVYISDGANHVVRRVDSKGSITMFAGNGDDLSTGDGSAASKASLRTPADLALDPSGNLAIVDADGHVVRSVNPQGVIKTLAGNGLATFLGDNGPATSASLSYPFGIASDAQGNIYIADTANSRIRKITPDGKITTVAGGGPVLALKDGIQATDAWVPFPVGVAVDNQGNIYYCDWLLQVVRKINTAGVITTVAGKSLSLGYSGDNGPATSAQLQLPTTVIVDPQGVLYIADTANNRVRMVTKDGIITTIAGNGQPNDGDTITFSGDGGPATQARVYLPYSLALDQAGSLYITDAGNGRIRKVDANGTIRTVAGGGQRNALNDGIPATTAFLEAPLGINVDAAGNLYIAESDGSRIRKVDARGIISTVAGVPDQPGFSGDGGPATQAQLSIPIGVAFNGANDLYILDAGNNRVRKILAMSVGYQTSPQSLTFKSSVGDLPQTQTVSVTSSVSGLQFTASASASWLSVSPASGAMPATLQVTADPKNLAAGSYTGTITITAPNAASPAQTVNVSLTVGAGAPPQLHASAASLNFAFVQGAAASTNQLTVSNTGAGSLDFTIDAATSQGGKWLSASPASGTAAAQAPVNIVVTANPAGLAPGSYRGQLTIKSAVTGTPVIVNVTMTIAAPAQKLLLSQTGLTFHAVAGGGAPLSQEFAILNVGKGSMNWTAQASTLSGGSWLSIGTSSGTVATPFLDAAPVEVKVNTSGLSQGLYFGQIQVRAPGAENGTQTVSIQLDIAASGTQLPPEVRPSGLVFTGLKGSRPSSQSISIANLQPGDIAYSSGKLTFDGANWFVHTPVNATVSANAPGKVVVQPVIQDLAPGIYYGAITFQFQDGTISPVKVLTVVAQPDAIAGNAVKSGAHAANGCTPKSIKMQLTSSPSPINVTVGQPNTLEVKVVDSCGQPVTAASTGAGVNASFSTGDPSVTMVHTQEGRWSRTWQPKLPNNGSGQARVSLTAIVLGSDLRPMSDKVDVMVNINNAAVAPIVNSGGILNGASFQDGVPVAPGSIISIFGVNMADGAASSSSVPLNTQIGATEVRLGDKTLPLYYADGSQINAQMPFDVPTDTQLQLVVRRGTAQSVPEAVNVSAALPAIFTTGQTGSGQGAITNAVTNAVADAAHPVKAGDIVAIYCTGLGAVSPAVTAGIPAPAQEPLARAVNPVSVNIGGKDAAVAFAGLAPNYIGLYQVNAVVPAGVAAGPQTPVTITVSGQTSRTVTIAVQ